MHECPVCFHSTQLFITPCGHNFCKACLQTLAARSDSGRDLPCPLCRRLVTIPNGDVATFPCRLQTPLIPSACLNQRARQPDSSIHSEDDTARELDTPSSVDLSRELDTPSSVDLSRELDTPSSVDLSRELATQSPDNQRIGAVTLPSVNQTRGSVAPSDVNLTAGSVTLPPVNQPRRAITHSRVIPTRRAVTPSDVNPTTGSVTLPPVNLTRRSVISSPSRAQPQDQQLRTDGELAVRCQQEEFLNLHNASRRIYSADRRMAFRLEQEEREAAGSQTRARRERLANSHPTNSEGRTPVAPPQREVKEPIHRRPPFTSSYTPLGQIGSVATPTYHHYDTNYPPNWYQQPVVAPYQAPYQTPYPASYRAPHLPPIQSCTTTTIVQGHNVYSQCTTIQPLFHFPAAHSVVPLIGWPYNHVQQIAQNALAYAQDPFGGMHFAPSSTQNWNTQHIFYHGLG